MTDWDNETIAETLLEFADLLEAQDANPYRVGAYRRAAGVVAAHAEPLSELAIREGAAGLDRLPAIGRSIAHAIEEMIETGHWSQLDRLRGQLEPEKLFRSIPGIGPTLAAAIHDALDVETLAGLEMAAHDGRLEAVPGIGPRRARMIAATLARMLQRRPARPLPDGREPPVEILLDVDREYRERAGRGELRTIAPRRFNPEGTSWLPILHTQRNGWHFTALYSNTARAHEFGRTRDWVVLYYHTDHDSERQCTVVTETRGRLRGQRVVRGREAEC
jgi:putative hydrolase